MQLWLTSLEAMLTFLFTQTVPSLKLLQSPLAAPSPFSFFQYSVVLDNSLRAN